MRSGGGGCKEGLLRETIKGGVASGGIILSMSEAIVGALVFSACLTLVSLAWGLAAWLYLSRKEREYQERIAQALRTALESPDENTPSPFAQVADQVCMLLAARIMQQLKTGLAGITSGVAKREAEGQQAALLEGGPAWLPLAASILPAKLKRQIAKNPQFLSALAGMGRGNGANAPEQSGGESVLSRLRRKEQ